LADFEARARARLAREPEPAEPERLPAHGDYRLNPSDADAGLLERARPAAVLIAALERDGEARVILTERTARLRSHAGQVAFPGGKIDLGEDARQAAFREAEEEIGLSARDARVLGHLPAYVTTSGYRISPVVAMARPRRDYAPNPDEVARVFEAPLAFLMNPAHHEIRSRPFQGRERFFYAMPWRDHYIWGVTAGVIRLLYERLYR
jgi:8-oxo-dGTP pyrophosphatase MutT (NUDIX family)